MTSFWHSFASMGDVAGNELTIDHGEGVYVYDDAGTRYLDGTASLWYCQVGYGRTEITDAVAAQMSRLHSYHTFGDFSSQPVTDLTDRIAGFSPHPRSKVFLTSGGSDSVDTAAKIARRYFQVTGEPERTVLISREWAYHGMHGWGTSLAGIESNFDGYGPLMTDVVKVKWDSIDALREAIGHIGAGRVAGFYAEPVIGAGGIRHAPDGYLKEARQVMSDAGALFVADEVITGFGRCGDWFVSNRFSLDPDLITFAKGVTSGYLPLGGVVAAPGIAAPFFEKGGPMLRHGYTYSGHTAVAAAALANLEIMEREGLNERALALESLMVEALDTLTDHPLVDGHRSGLGVLGAVVLDAERTAEDPELPTRVFLACREVGLITRAIGGDSLQVSPPLVISEEELDELVTLLRSGLDAVA